MTEFSENFSMPEYNKLKEAFFRALMKLRAPEHDIEAELTNMRDGLAQQNSEQGTFLRQVILERLNMPVHAFLLE